MILRHTKNSKKGAGRFLRNLLPWSLATLVARVSIRAMRPGRNEYIIPSFI